MVIILRVMMNRQFGRLGIPWPQGNYTILIRLEVYMVTKVINLLRQSAMSLNAELVSKTLNF
jgi:hypothetical protein